MPRFRGGRPTFRRGWLGLAALGLVAGACGGGATHPAAGGTTPPSNTAHRNRAPAGPTNTTAAPTTTTPCVSVAGWSTARLAAATIAVPAQETAPGQVEAEVAAGAGGVVLFGTAAPTDLGAQLAALRRAAPGGQGGLLVMTDEEGGGVQRMANLVGNLPWAAAMGASWNLAEITSQVAAVARKMAAAGVNMDLAPVVDVDGRGVTPGSTDPDGFRAFSGNATAVSLEGEAYLQGLRQGGVIGVLKHFPGLGGASANTDDGPASTPPWATLQRASLPPFAAGIRAGAKAVMVANASVPGLTTLPASLSSSAITGQLVGTLHFHGLVLTDSLSAKAISAAGYSVPAAAVAALTAGADLVLYDWAGPTATDGTFQQTVAAVESAVADGTLTRSRLVAAAGATLVARHVNACR